MLPLLQLHGRLTLLALVLQALLGSNAVGATRMGGYGGWLWYYQPRWGQDKDGDKEFRTPVHLFVSHSGASSGRGKKIDVHLHSRRSRQ